MIRNRFSRFPGDQPTYWMKSRCQGLNHGLRMRKNQAQSWPAGVRIHWLRRAAEGRRLQEKSGGRQTRGPPAGASNGSSHEYRFRLVIRKGIIKPGLDDGHGQQKFLVIDLHPLHPHHLDPSDLYDFHCRNREGGVRLFSHLVFQWLKFPTHTPGIIFSIKKQ